MKTVQVTTMVFGMLAIAVGIWRQLETGTSPQAVWFGVVTGLLAVIGALLLSLRNRIPGYVLVIVSLCFVAGWFLRRLLTGHAEGRSVRVMLILAACAVEACVLIYGILKGRRAGEEKGQA